MKVYPPYFGNGAYCWSDVTASLLNVYGENISPSIIEVLGGVGLGAFFSKETGLIYFSWELPDNGIDNALQMLGFKVKKVKILKQNNNVPIEELKKDLANSFAIIGPVDMGYLTYDPDCKYHGGVDHFILAISLDQEEVKLHDPAGFPYVYLKIEDLNKAWSSPKIPYSKTHYQYWTRPKRVAHPNNAEVLQDAIRLFKDLYKIADKLALEKQQYIGEQAILEFAKTLKKKQVSQSIFQHLVYFALPLGARRAADFAEFFGNRYSNLYSLKQEQAQIFGKCHTLAIRRNWQELAKKLQELADTEKGFKDALMKL